MTSDVQALQMPLREKGDIRFAIIGGGTILFSLAVFTAGRLGALSSTLSTSLTLLSVGVVLRIAWAYAARSATSAGRTRMTLIASSVGLSISAVAMLIALPLLTRTGGVGLLCTDLAAQLWTIAELSILAAPVRTLGWRVFAGAFMTGFLGLTALGRFIARPLVVKLGASSVLAVGVWVPLTEELCKLLPVVLVLALALRRKDVRPSLMDLILLAAWSAAGFQLYENATYGRGSFSLSSSIGLSLFEPSLLLGRAFGWQVMQSGHVLHSALIALGVGFWFLYKNFIRRAWIIPAVTIGVVLFEHCTQNAISVGGLSEVVARSTLVLTFGGRLSPLLLILGLAAVARLEWRAVAEPFDVIEWFRLSPQSAARRARLLAAAQVSGGAAK